MDIESSVTNATSTMRVVIDSPYFFSANTQSFVNPFAKILALCSGKIRKQLFG